MNAILWELGMKNTLITITSVGILLGAGIWWSRSLQKSDPDIISVNGIHWHPTLEIYVKGEKQIIPSDIGIGTQYVSHPTYDPSMRMTAIHTHDDANEGIIHLEFNGIVRKEDTKLSQFLAIWGKDFNSFGENISMIVNGEPNYQLGDYGMKDRDKIVLNYE
jgi:hypothetical protein